MIIREGLVEAEVPDDHGVKGPGHRESGFYNAAQKLNRDTTICFLNTVRPGLALDAFGGSGIRGIRFDREIGIKTVIAENNPRSVSMIQGNVTRNKSSCTVIQGDCESVMRDFLFSFIDVDPYGSAMPYIDSALRNVRNHGYIGVTATDLTALTGSAEKVTRRRYGAFLTVDDLKHEKGVRLLIRAVIERGAQYDRAAVPLLAFWHSHFYRVIFQVSEGAGRSDQLLEKIGTVNINGKDQGPIWLGNMESGEIIDSLNVPDHMKEPGDVAGFIRSLKNEDICPLFTDLRTVCSKLKTDIPKVSSVIERLESMGHVAARTHFSPTGIKHSASCSAEEIESAVRSN